MHEKKILAEGDGELGEGGSSTEFESSCLKVERVRHVARLLGHVGELEVAAAAPLDAVRVEWAARRSRDFLDTRGNWR